MSGANEIRDHLVESLEADLVGTFGRKPGDAWSDAPEVLRNAPSRVYLTGFLVPDGAPPDEAEDPTEEDDALGAGDDEDDPDVPPPEPTVRRRGRLPSSFGLSVLVPAATRELVATLCWADYHCLSEATASEKAQRTWSRVFRGPVQVTLPLSAEAIEEGLPVPDSRGLYLTGHLQPADARGLPEGTRALSLFLVNRRQAQAGAVREEAYAFQVRMALRCAEGFVDRGNRRDEGASDWDERVADLQFRERAEYAVGHGVSATWERDPGGLVREVATTWLPRVDVPRVIPREVDGVTVDMEKLAALADGEAARAQLAPLVEAYGAWIAECDALALESPHRRETRAQIVERAQEARRRISEGIALLGREPLALEAFRIANRAMAKVSRLSRPEDAPKILDSARSGSPSACG